MQNRLANEDSPYLQQHKNNPVDWYPWCDEAFERARNEQRPIFISIGYSSCHWCHVMEHEVFENETIAAYLNEHFISIKVDREERPDLDKYYQEVHQLLNRRPGGWPTSIFCTPENKPFFAGTYIPPNTRDRMLGFSELIEIIATKVAEGDEKLFSNADEIQNYLKPEDRPKEATVLKPSLIRTFVKQAQHNFESVHGGFSQQPKFPHSSTLNALLDITLLQNDTEAKMMLTQSLSTMHRGGMYDLVDGGFCRYSVDEQWLVPHFEKMAYDNGLLCELYARAGRMLGDESYLRTAKEIARFMGDKMQEDNLFYSASDADSEGGEGTYFIVGFDAAAQALSEHGFSDEDAETILQTLHITPQGNFEGKNIVWLDAPAERPEWFEAVREAFIALRKEREYPFIDRKIQTSWNAMMIRGLFELGKSDAQYTEKAVTALKAVMAFLMPKGELHHTALIHSTPKVGAFLEDYAYLGTAFVKAYEATLDDLYLMKAQQMANLALETFYDNGRWYFSKGEFTTDADPTDASYPGSVGVMVDLLLSLGILLEEKYRRFAFKTLEYYSARLAKTPIYFPYLFGQTVRYLFEDLLVKATPEKLALASDALAGVTYPYVHVKASSDDAYMLCGVQSCFAQLKTVEEIAPTLREKFSVL
jgi:uncharacterized protein YyaL (SSP411 family)